jgi:hypothetical protein
MASQLRARTRWILCPKVRVSNTLTEVHAEGIKGRVRNGPAFFVYFNRKSSMNFTCPTWR